MYGGTGKDFPEKIKGNFERRMNLVNSQQKLKSYNSEEFRGPNG